MGPNLVSITPDNDYVDGCRALTLQGHDLGTSATARIGDMELALTPAEEDTDLPDHAQDVGFLYTTTAPPAPAAGFYDVTMTVDGERLTLPKGFYYRSCDAPLTLDVAVFEGAAGDTLPLEGCGIDASTTSGRLLGMLDGSEVATFDLTQVCSTASATWTVPSVAAGTYILELTSGETVVGGWCEPPDEGDTDAPPCPDPVTFTVTE